MVLTPEAAAILTEATNNAKQAKHVHVTVLHVASVMLSTLTGIFQAACGLAYPLSLEYDIDVRYRSIALFFNIALKNSVPEDRNSSAENPGLIYSKGLVTVLRRAHQQQGNRGSVENQELTMVGVDKLLIAVLDDPTVSQAMEKAGYRSTLVKAKVEEAMLGGGRITQQFKDDTAKRSLSSFSPSSSTSRRKIDHENNQTMESTADGNKDNNTSSRKVLFDLNVPAYEDDD